MKGKGLRGLGDGNIDIKSVVVVSRMMGHGEVDEIIAPRFLKWIVTGLPIFWWMIDFNAM